MHIIIGFVALGALVAFAFGRRALQIFVAIGLGVPALIVLVFIVGEVTRGGPDDIPFGKLGHRVTVEQPAAEAPSMMSRVSRMFMQGVPEGQRDQAAAEVRRAAAAVYDAIATHLPRGGFPANGVKPN
jgi:hypothetical protein